MAKLVRPDLLILPLLDYLHERLRYDEVTGYLYWKAKISDDWRDRAWNSRWEGSRAGYFRPSTGYWHVSIDGVIYLAHRIIWKMQTGREPAYLDHIDTTKSNVMANLREATLSQNGGNRGPNKNNSCGFKGVDLHRGKWRAQIVVEGVVHCLGEYPTSEMASDAYVTAAKKYRGEFARWDRPTIPE